MLFFAPCLVPDRSPDSEKGSTSVSDAWPFDLDLLDPHPDDPFDFLRRDCFGIPGPSREVDSSPLKLWCRLDDLVLPSWLSEMTDPPEEWWRLLCFGASEGFRAGESNGKAPPDDDERRLLCFSLEVVGGFSPSVLFISTNAPKFQH